MLLGFDTETSGLPEWKKPSNDPSQPYIVSLAAVLRSHDKSVEPEAMMDRIIRPDGWAIDEAGEAFRTHGITNERALDEGVPIIDVLDEFLAMAEKADSLIGYNVTFDKRMIRIQEKRRYPDLSEDGEFPIGVRLALLKTCELSHKMTPFCQLPPTDKMMAAGRKTNKTPNLTEAFTHAYGNIDRLEGAMHSAMTDVKAAMALYWWLLERNTTWAEGAA